MIGIQLQPVDSWFFRGGTPFTKGSTPQENVESLFPPSPLTVAGALRATLALGKGWNGYSRWPGNICEVLGDGPEKLGALSLAGPFLLRDSRPLFRVPRHLLGVSNGTGWEPRAFLRPGDPVTCDLGDAVRLPEVVSPPPDADLADLKPDKNCWLKWEGLVDVLHGRFPAPNNLIPDGCLWEFEPRIGLERRDDGTRTAREGMLYSSRHVRPARGVSLGVRICGLPAGWTPPLDGLLTLGGEGRLAECREWKAELKLKVPVDTRRVALVALSPLDISRDICAGDQPIETLGNARVVSACLDRPQRIGGWNSLDRRPLPLRSVLPPGSTLFCEVADPERFKAALKHDGLARIGLRQKWGFGLVAPGVWPASKEDD